MNKQQLHELPEKFSLTFLAFCGMTTDHLEDASYQQCRDEVARILKQKRQDPETDWEINVIEPNLRWEVIDDDDPGYRSGVYRITPPEIKGRCDQCGSYICAGDKHYLSTFGGGYCSLYCFEKEMQEDSEEE